ncbi:MAG: pyridoxamine 5'-phosphate oxidase family protein [Pseudomonadota bacterium]
MITDEAALRAIYGPPMQRAVDKQLDRIDDHVRAFIAASPFLTLATSDGERLDVSPKGDAPGFVRCDGDRAILIPDWPGNNRLDGLTNLLSHPRAAAIFLIPGVKDTLRINGPAAIHDEETIRARFETRGRLPLTVIRIETEEVFLHCSKAFLRSRLWQPESWPPERPIPSTAEMLDAHIGYAPAGPKPTDDELEARYAKTLY